MLEVAAYDATVDVWGLTVAAFRRWYVLIPLVLVSLGLAYLAGSRTQSEYELDGAVLLLVPSGDPVATNPYASAAGVEILGLKAMSSSTRASFEDEGLSSDYDISYDRRSPVIRFELVADSELAALGTGEGLVEYLANTLNESQGDLGIRDADRVTLEVVDAPDDVVPVAKGRLRVTAVIAVLGVIASFAVAVFTDAILVRQASHAPPRRMPGELEVEPEDHGVLPTRLRHDRSDG